MRNAWGETNGGLGTGPPQGRQPYALVAGRLPDGAKKRRAPGPYSDLDTDILIRYTHS
jgi:hypothetical protein